MSNQNKLKAALAALALLSVFAFTSSHSETATRAQQAVNEPHLNFGNSTTNVVLNNNPKLAYDAATNKFYVAGPSIESSIVKFCVNDVSHDDFCLQAHQLRKLVQELNER